MTMCLVGGRKKESEKVIMHPKVGSPTKNP
jgi:hypothetical protein